MGAIADFTQSLIFLRRREGGAFVIRQAIHQLLEFRKANILYLSLIEPPGIIPAIIQLTVRQASLEDFSQFADLVPRLRIQRFIRKIKLGELCFVGIAERRIVAFAWSAFKNTPSSKEYPLSLSDKDAYLWGFYCTPEFRAKGVMTNLAQTMCCHLQGKGYEAAYLMVEVNNAPSIRQTQKMNAKMVGHVMSLRILGQGIIHLTGPQLHSRIVRSESGKQF